MKKIAVGLFGIHYCKNFNHWMGWLHDIDYRYTYNNNIEKIYKLFDIDYYSCTYNSDIINELLKNFNFKNYKLKTISNVKEDNIELNWKKRNVIFKETLKLIINSNIEYDFVILTRYDCNFLQYFNELNIDYKKINFLCKSKCGDRNDFSDDNFYIIPFNLLYHFQNIISKIDETIWSHDYHKYFLNDEINYMIDGYFYSHEIQFYQICRIPIK